MEKEFEEKNIFGLGEENVVYEKYFIGKSYLKMLTRSPFWNCQRYF